MNDQNPILDLLAIPAQMLLNRGVQRSTTAEALCQRLEGKTFAIDTGTADMNAYFTVADGELSLNAGMPEEPDAVLSGTPLTLAWFAAADPEEVIREHSINISGNAGVSADFRLLLDLVRPDWEEELATFTGDAIAHEVMRAARGFADWLSLARRSLERSMVEFLTEESRDLVAPTEIEEFNQGVDEVSNGVERLEARLEMLREQLGEDES